MLPTYVHVLIQVLIPKSNTHSGYVKIPYQSNHAAILQLRQSSVHGGSHNQASLPASPDAFTTITLSLADDFKWLGHSTSTLDLSRLGKFNFAFLSQNNHDGFADRLYDFNATEQITTIFYLLCDL